MICLIKIIFQSKNNNLKYINKIILHDLNMIPFQKKQKYKIQKNNNLIFINGSIT